MIKIIWNDEFWHHLKDDKKECRGWSCNHFRMDTTQFPGPKSCCLNSCKFKKTTRKAVENPRGISGHFAVKSSQRIGKYYGGNW